MTLRGCSSLWLHSGLMGVSGIVPGKIMEWPATMRPMALWIVLLQHNSQSSRRSCSRLCLVQFLSHEMLVAGNPSALWIALLDSLHAFYLFCFCVLPVVKGLKTRYNDRSHQSTRQYEKQSEYTLKENNLMELKMVEWSNFLPYFLKKLRNKCL